MRAGGVEVIREITDITHPLIHAIEQPIQNVFHEAKEVIQMPTHLFTLGVNLGTYFVMGWLGWTAFSEMFPREKRMLVNGIDRAFKRTRRTQSIR